MSFSSSARQCYFFYRHYFVAAVSAVLMVSLLPTVHASELVRISNGVGGNESNDVSYRSDISEDGRYVAFVSDATNLVPSDTNARSDVFVYDRRLQTIERVSVGTGNVQSFGDSDHPSISADGRYVAFQSLSFNLALPDANNEIDVFVHDRQTGVTRMVSRNLQGQPGDNESQFASISADGNYIAFQSLANNLTELRSPGSAQDVYIRNMTTGDIQIVSVDVNGNPSNIFDTPPAISSDGRKVAWSAGTTDYVLNETNDRFDRQIFVRDMDTAVTTLVSKNIAGVTADQDADVPAFSPDGSKVVFNTNARSLWPDTPGRENIFINDYPALNLFPVNWRNDNEWLSGNSENADVSMEGRYVSFQSTATNVAGQRRNNFSSNIFVRDTLNSTIERVSETPEGVSGDLDSLDATMSASGRYLSFTSSARELINDDTNLVSDIYLVDRGSEFDALAVENQFLLRNAEWALLSLPIEVTETTTVTEVFADDITGVYGVDWAIFTYDASTSEPTYIRAEPGDTLRSGQGFWIQQVTGADVLLDMPLDSRGVSTNFDAETACISQIGCRDVVLSGVDPVVEPRWNMIGNPFQANISVNFSDLRLSTTSGPCGVAAGCTFDEAFASDTAFNQFFRYNGIGYDIVRTGSAMRAWEGYWVAELEGAYNNSPVIRFPE